MITPRVAMRIDFNWERVLERRDFFSAASDKWIFRGVTDIDNHLLVPKVGRPGMRKDPENGEVLRYCESEEKRMLEDFERRGRRAGFFKHKPAGPLEVMAVAQHHGMPTRLLDWTENLLVAAYFGAKHAGAGESQGGVYAVRLTEFDEFTGGDDPFSVEQRIAWYRPPSYFADRISAQSALFTIHREPDADPFQPEELQVFAFPFGPEFGRETFRIKRMLDERDINEATLFPDIDGLARHVGWRHKWGWLR